MGPPPMLKGWRYAAFVSALVGSIGMAIYPIIISPMIDPTPWKETSAQVRSKSGIKQEEIQPGGMKVWTDPFDRPGKPGNK